MADRTNPGPRRAPARPDRSRVDERRTDRSRVFTRWTQTAAPMSVRHPVPGQKIEISGFVDATSVTDVRTELHEAVDHGIGELVVTLDGFVLGDATGLGALLGAHRRANRAGRSLVLTGVPDGLRRALRYTRLIRVLDVREGVAPARAERSVAATA